MRAVGGPVSINCVYCILSSALFVAIVLIQDNMVSYASIFSMSLSFILAIISFALVREREDEDNWVPDLLINIIHIAILFFNIMYFGGTVINFVFIVFLIIKMLVYFILDTSDNAKDEEEASLVIGSIAFIILTVFYHYNLIDLSGFVLCKALCWYAYTLVGAIVILIVIEFIKHAVEEWF